MVTVSFRQAAKKQLNALSARLHKNVKFTLERPANCSKSRLRSVPVREINNKHVSTIGEMGKRIEEEKVKRLQNSEVKVKEIVEEKAEAKIQDKVEASEEVKNQETKEKPMIEEIVEEVKEETDEKLNFNKPSSSLDLERDWRSLPSQSQKAAYLRFIDDAPLTARCFASQLPKYIVDICNTLLVKMSATIEDARLSHELLKEMAKLPRFQTTMFFLLDAEKETIKSLLTALSKHVTLSAPLIQAYTV